MKLLFLDTETTGLDPVKHGIIQIAGIVEIDGEVEREFNIECQPLPSDVIDAQALAINKVEITRLGQRMAHGLAFTSFTGMMNKYVDRYAKNDKFYMVGQNAKFDYDFMQNWFTKCGDPFFHAYVRYHLIDLIPIATLFKLAGLLDVPNFQLGTVCKALNVPLDAHDAMNDIRATRACFKKFIQMAQGNQDLFSRPTA
jgi:DNA polymerase-3 subunit epsilon